MAEEKRWTGSTRGGFLLGESYGEPGPGLGTLYEAWRVGSGRPALVLLPGDHTQWRPEGPWRVSIACEDPRDSVSLDMEQAPAGVSLTELANLLVLTSATVERVEEHSRVQAHLASGSVSLAAPRRSRARPSWVAPALAGMAVFTLGLGVGRFVSSGSAPPVEPSPGVDGHDFTAVASPYLLGTGSADAGTIAYPLPAKPFSDQAMAPCKRYEVDLNGGCWLELGQRPPCEKDVHVEHQGKCYAPVAKRPRTPQAVEPTGR